MALTLQFVDSIDATPTVLLDLNDDEPFFVTGRGWFAPPPQLQRSEFSSSARDGSTVAQSAYFDRELTVTLGINSESQDDSAEAIQALGRLLNSDGQWLKLNTGTTLPVFFRTKRAEIDQLEEFNGQEDGFRTATLTIPAEPFAYGLPVSDTVTIRNDPTDATNPMSYVFPDVMGDVASPLLVKVDYSATSVTERCLIVGSSALPTGVSGGLVLFDVGTIQETTNWVRSVVADATAVGGSYVRFTPPYPGPPLPDPSDVVTTKVSVPGVARGDYRVLIRARGDSDAPGLAISYRAWAGIGDSIDVPAASRASIVVVTEDWRWVDAGVVRMPGGSPRAPELDDTDLPSSMLTTVAIEVNIPTAGVTHADIDTIMLVPAGLDRASLSSLLLARAEPTFVDSEVWADAINDAANLVTDNGGSTSLQPLIFGGGLPYVLPGATNELYLVPHLSQVDHVEEDDKTEAYDVDYLYYPRYLYVRPAAS